MKLRTLKKDESDLLKDITEMEIERIRREPNDVAGLFITEGKRKIFSFAE